MRGTKRTKLLSLFHNGVSAVKGDRAVHRWLPRSEILQPTHILAAGKAAVSMFEGLPTAWRTLAPSLVITKTHHLGSADLGSNVATFEASHPIPDLTSLIAGKAALDFVEGCDANSRLLLLISGGASSLVEHLMDGADYAELVEATKAALSDGADIAEINRRRKDLSAVKGGKLLSVFKGRRVDVLAISDVCGDGIDVIGSGLGAKPQDASFDYSASIIASNAVARLAVSQEAQTLGIPVIANEETMYADVADVARDIARNVNSGPSGLYIYGGEPTVVLPNNPGTGGRNQALALELSRHFRNHDNIIGLVAGTDGTDGPTDAAGAYVDGTIFDKKPGADAALRQANSASHLARTGAQIKTGPTGTNVMDLAIVLKQN